MIGRVDGYVFNPKLPHRRMSPRCWPTPEAATPDWAKRLATRIEVLEVTEADLGDRG